MFTEVKTDNGRIVYKNDTDNRLYFSNLEVGDTVERITTPSRYTSPVVHGGKYVVRTTSRSSNSEGWYINGSYQYVYYQMLQVDGVSSTYKASHFKKLDKKENTMLAIESNRPTFVREFTENTVDGKVVRSYVGEWAEFDSLSAARVFTSNLITDSIREKNTYRQFAIFSENAIARAKKPEIEFA